MRPVIDRRRGSGVTLVEMIVVIAVTGVLVALVSLFGRRQIDAYFDVANRAALTDAADTALRRIGREVQGALPNSVRSAGGNQFLEFVPVRDGGRYRGELTPAGTGNPLDLSNAADTTFDVLGPTVTAAAGDRLVIYNLGQPGSDVYAGTSSRALTTTGAGLSALGFAGGQFPFGSPRRRFQIVGGPVTYECTATQLLRRWCYDFQAVQPTGGFAALPVHGACAAVQTAVLVDNLAACNLNYVAGALARNGLVSISLTLSANGEAVTLMHQVEVLNAP